MSDPNFSSWSGQQPPYGSQPRGGWQGSVYSGSSGGGTLSDDGPSPRSRASLWLGAGCVTIVLLLIAVAVTGFMTLQRAGKQRKAQPSQGPASSAPVHSPSPRATPTVPVTVPPEQPLPDYGSGGSRTVGRIEDKKAGISYAQFGSPWERGTSGFGSFTAGQSFVTETGSDGSKWWATFLSVPLPSKARAYCAGKESLSTVATAAAKTYMSLYYTEEFERTVIASQQVEVDDHRIYLVGYELSFEPPPGMEVSKETVVIATIDAEKQYPAVLYASVPGTHYQFRPDINTLYESVKILDTKPKKRSKKPSPSTGPGEQRKKPCFGDKQPRNNDPQPI